MTRFWSVKVYNVIIGLRDYEISKFITILSDYEIMNALFSSLFSGFAKSHLIMFKAVKKPISILLGFTFTAVYI